MKKVLVDLYHLPQYNFFKNTILSLDPSEVDIYCVDRGKLYQVIRYELPQYTVRCLGSYKHNKGVFSMAFKIIIPRLFRLYREVTRSKYRMVVTAHYQANLVAKLRGIPNVAFLDDPRKGVVPILKFSADEFYLPPFENRRKGIKYFNALKEWSYLSPHYLTPDKSVLEPYGLKPKQYIFVREVSTDTSNYLAQNRDIILSVASQFPPDLKVVLSLENKENAREYPAHWIILKEPVPQIHSLMYFSEVVISSGDSVAREGAMLGVPSIYAGIREMPANWILIKKGILLKLAPDEIVPVVSAIREGRKVLPGQEEFRDSLLREWDDVTSLVLNKLEEYKT